MRRYGATFLVILSLGACAPRTDVLDARAVEIPQPQLVDRVVQHDVTFEPARTSVSPDERAELRAFLDRYGIGPSARMLVTAEGSGAHARQQSLVALLRAWGYAPVATGGSSAGWGGTNSALVTVRETIMTEPPGCATSAARNAAFEAHEVPINRFGCSTAQNLGAMIYDPRDLASGNIMGRADGERAASMFHTWLVLPSTLVPSAATSGVSTTGGN